MTARPVAVVDDRATGQNEPERPAPIEIAGTLADDEHEYALDAMKGIYPRTDGPSGPPGPEVFIGSNGLPEGWTGALDAATTSLQACYSRALMEDPRLQASLEVIYAVAPDGKVTAVEVADLAEPLAACVRDVFAKLVLTPSPRARNARVTVPVMFVGGGADLPL